MTTGGADPANPTPACSSTSCCAAARTSGARRRRYYFENNDMQSDNVGSDLAGQLHELQPHRVLQGLRRRGRRSADRGQAVGVGRVRQDQPGDRDLHATAANRRHRVPHGSRVRGRRASATSRRRTRTTSRARDCTILKNTRRKVDRQAHYNCARVEFTYFRGDKQKFGRGASATRPTETTWNQDGPTDMFKGEVNYTMSNSTFLTGRYAYTGGGFSLEPIGGRDAQSSLDDNGVWQRHLPVLRTDRPQHNVQIEGNHFRGSHEFKFGFGWRKASVASQSGWPRRRAEHPWRRGRTDPVSDDLAQFTRDADGKDEHDLLERVPRRPDLAEPADDQPRRALGSPGGQSRGRHGGGRACDR